MKKYIFIALLLLQPFTYGARHHRKKSTPQQKETPVKQQKESIVLFPSICAQALKEKDHSFVTTPKTVFDDIHENIRIKELKYPIHSLPLFSRVVFAAHLQLEKRLEQCHISNAIFNIDRLITLYRKRLEIEPHSESRVILRTDIKTYKKLKAQLLSGASYKDLNLKKLCA